MFLKYVISQVTLYTFSYADILLECTSDDIFVLFRMCSGSSGHLRPVQHLHTSPEPHLHSVHTQWEDPSQQDHQYCNRSRRKDMQLHLILHISLALLHAGIALRPQQHR